MLRQTTNYDMFIFNKYNREININSLKKIQQSIERKNLLEEFPINVIKRNGYLEIMDGQHRLAAAKNLGVPIFYKISNNMDINDIAIINNSRKGWNLENYINRFRDRNDCYQFLHDKIINDKFSPSSLMTLINGYDSNGHASKSQSSTHSLKQGNLDFNIKNLKSKIEILQKYSFYKEYKTYRFITALFKMEKMDNFSHDRMIMKMKSNELEKRGSMVDYIKYFGRMYNHGLSNKLQFSTLYQVD